MKGGDGVLALFAHSGVGGSLRNPEVQGTPGVRRLPTVLPHGFSAQMRKPFLRQAGTWDPLLPCLYLDNRLLELQNTKELKGTKNNCTPAQLGQILDKIQKDQK